MDVFVQILSSGLTLGAMYAVSTIGLALVYGSLNMLNMSHGALLALGGYVCLYAMSVLGLPALLAVPVAMAACGAAGLAIYHLAARPMLASRNFETQIFIATIGIGAVLESVILRSFGPQPVAQPLNLQGAVTVGGVHIPNQNILMAGTVPTSAC
jgi:branched-chain amino acid transport system permease protein